MNYYIDNPIQAIPCQHCGAYLSEYDLQRVSLMCSVCKSEGHENDGYEPCPICMQGVNDRLGDWYTL